MRKFKVGDKVKTNGAIKSGTIVDPDIVLTDKSRQKNYALMNGNNTFYIVIPDDPSWHAEGMFGGKFWGYDECYLTLISTAAAVINKTQLSSSGCSHSKVKDVFIGPMIGYVKVCQNCKQEI
jgi:hypothetical protein